MSQMSDKNNVQNYTLLITTHISFVLVSVVPKCLNFEAFSKKLYMYSKSNEKFLNM